MKLFVKVKNELNGLLPRDIRDLTGSIVNEEYKDDVLWHKHKPPKLIFAKPVKKGFEIINYTNDYNLLLHIKDKLENIKSFNLKITDLKLMRLK